MSSVIVSNGATLVVNLYYKFFTYPKEDDGSESTQVYYQNFTKEIKEKVNLECTFEELNRLRSVVLAEVLNKEGLNKDKFNIQLLDNTKEVKYGLAEATLILNHPEAKSAYDIAGDIFDYPTAINGTIESYSETEDLYWELMISTIGGAVSPAVKLLYSSNFEDGGKI